MFLKFTKMKHKLFFASIIIVASSFMIPVKKTAEKISSHPMAYSIGTMDANGKVGKLEQSIAYHKTAVKIPIHTIAGAKSSRRLKTTNFNFNVSPDNASSQLNPSYYIFLYKLNEASDRRTFTDNLNTSAPSTNPLIIPITITQKDSDSYSIEVQGALLKGEYAFIDKSTIDNAQITVWAFGID